MTSNKSENYIKSTNQGNKVNCDVFIPIRLDSKRLPNKHLKKINGVPVIKYLIDRLHSSTKIRNIVVCTTDQKSDDFLVDYLKKEGIQYFRGDNLDILSRYLNAAKKFDTDIIIDVGGDDIYTDPYYVDKLAQELTDSDFDYIEGNGFPHGLVPAAFKQSSLARLCKLKKSNNTEHGYRLFFKENKIFKCKYIQPENRIEVSDKIRLTLDYQEDFELAVIIFNLLGNNFHLNDIIKLVTDKPDLLRKMEQIEQKWKKNFSENKLSYSLDNK